MQYKYSFFDDYSEGAHPQILQALVTHNNQQALGYGIDEFTIQATKLIRQKIENEHVDVYFVSTGTQANLVGISWLLKSYESIIAANTGHICVYEVGAIEATGHKVHEAPAEGGKLKPETIQKTVDTHNMDQMVFPKAVYITQSTEVGSVYSKAELVAISQVCRKNNLYLYLDGARLAHALASETADFTLKDIADLADIFYIGGTKNGGLMGEAMVIVNPELKKNFRFHLRQKGALLSKARAVSIQFTEFFNDDLYLKNAQHANQMAQKLKQGIQQLGYSFLAESPTNQLFPILPNEMIEKLEKSYGFYRWTNVDEEKTVIRLVTSWATPSEMIDMFLGDLRNISV